ncbi:MAG: EcsC family protein [Spirochaetia bacterium]|jgi:hypothetical protein|nr:EcsC family protein [Spirochaetia bacterium]
MLEKKGALKKFSGRADLVKKSGEEKIQKWAEEFLTLLKTTIEKESPYVEEYVNHLRELNEGIDRESLSKKIISRRSWKAGGVGAVSGLGGLITLPVTMPSDMYLTFRIQARMVLAIAYIYGWNIHDEEISTDILLVMGGNAGINAVKNLGIKTGQEIAKKSVQKHITREVMKKINKVVSRKIITKAGEKSILSFSKLVPVIGAPIGGSFDFFGTKAVGHTALKFYKG